MSQHSPGPWTVEPLLGSQYKFLIIKASNGETVTHVCVNNFAGKEEKDGWVREVWKERPQAQADANVIGAALELRDALKDLLNCVDGQHDREWYLRCRQRALLAIGKADGAADIEVEKVAAE